MGHHVTRLAAVILLGTVAGCSAAGPPTPVSSGPALPAPVSNGPVAPGVAVLDCDHDLGGTAPGADTYRLVLDAVALPAGRLEPQESGEPGWLFAKQGLIVRAGTPVEIAVAPQASGLARIGWGEPGPRGTTIRVPACPSRTGWLAFAGGYLVRSPACVPLIVRAGGREERAGVDAGASCP